MTLIPSFAAHVADCASLYSIIYNEMLGGCRPHLVLGPGPDGKPVRFRVTIDGAPPGGGQGADVDGDGQGVVTGQRLYQLIRQTGKVSDRTFEIQFLDPGVQAYAFTFG